MNNTDFSHIEKSDRPEMMKNRHHTICMTLFQKILNDFYSEDFTVDDISEMYNQAWKKKAYGQRYGKSHLDYMVEKDLLIFDEGTESYSINYNSDYIAQILDGDE